MSNVKRILWVTGGTLSFVIGIIGIVVPILPTTPLIILACFCYGKSSPGLHRWLTTNKYFGKYIQDYQRGHGVPMHIKLYAVALVWMGIISSLFVIPLFLVRALMITIGIGVTIFILTSPLLKEKDMPVHPVHGKVAK